MVKVKVAKPRIALIVPVRNDEARLPAVLDAAMAARQRYHAGERGVEIIVVDRGSTDDTVAVARARGCRVTETPDRSLGAARNAGARLTQGDVLAFATTEFELDPDTFNAVNAAIETDRAAGGVTGVVASATSADVGFLRRAVLGFRRSLGVIPGLVFCRHDIFRAIGGYPEHRLVPDEARFLKSVAAWGKGLDRPLVQVDSVPARIASGPSRNAGFFELIRELPVALSWRLFLRRAFRVATNSKKPGVGGISDAE